METATLTPAPIRSADFFFAGNAIFTVAPPAPFLAKHPECCERYTFKIIHKEKSDRWPECWMVLLLTGPDNTSDYTYLGRLGSKTETRVRLSQKSCCGQEAWPVKIIDRILARAVAGQMDVITNAGWGLMHEGRCCRCGRRLTVPSSIEAGIGPECAGKAGGQ